MEDLKTTEDVQLFRLTPTVALEYFKNQDHMIHGFALVETDRMAVVCRAWMTAQVKWDPPQEYPLELQHDEGLLWNELWKSCKAPMSQMASASGLTSTSFLALFRQLKDLKLVYPDGSIAESLKTTMSIRLRQVLSKGLPASKLPTVGKKEEETKSTKKFDA